MSVKKKNKTLVQLTVSNRLAHGLVVEANVDYGRLELGIQIRDGSVLFLSFLFKLLAYALQLLDLGRVGSDSFFVSVWKIRFE